MKAFSRAVAQLRTSCASAEFGIEDARVFVWRDAVWGIAAGISPAPHGGLKATQILFRMDGSDIVEFHELQSPNKSNMEKNWVPLVADDTLYLLYGICPYVVFAYEDGQLKAIRGPVAQDNKFALRGSSQFIPVKEKYVGVCHFERTEVEDKYYYRHVFVIINKHLDLEQISEPFFIQRKGVEFCCGLSRYDDGLLLSYGVMKLNSAFCLVPFSELSKWIVV